MAGAWTVASGEAGYRVREQLANLPAETAPVVCWGDPRLGNIIWRDDRAACLTDFEAASIAPAEVDLGWWLMFDRWCHETYGAPRREGEISRDGQWLVARAGGQVAQSGGRDISALRLGTDTALTPLVATSYDESEIALSPDGRWLAYVSDETGHTEVLLRPFPKGSGRWQASTAGGDMPRWSADGARLYYLQDGDLLMEVEVDLGGMPRLSDPRPLFSAADRRLGLEHGYDPAPDGQGFITVELQNLSDGGDLTLIRPWPPQTAAR